MKITFFFSFIKFILLKKHKETKKMTTKTIKLKSNKEDVKKSFSYNHINNFYFIEYKYKHLKIKLKLSKNQMRKFKRFDTLPECPQNKRVLSNFSYKSFNTHKFKNKGYYNIDIFGMTYIFKFLNDDHVLLSEHGLNTIKNLMINYILTA